MDKLGRNFRLTVSPAVGDDSQNIVVASPFTIQFSVERSNQANLNYANIEVYNLSAKIRDRIFQDRFVTNRKRLILDVGYSNLSTIFKGDIWEANSRREGTDIITAFECKEGIFDVANTLTIKTVNVSDQAALLKSLVADFPNLTQGAIGNLTASLTRPVVLNGNTWDLIKRYTDGRCYIDGDQVYILQDNESLSTSGQIPVIDAGTGLLDTPRRDDGWLTVTTLLEPSIQMSQLVQLNSTVGKQYNGQYKVIGIQHQGIISGAVSGQCGSQFQLLTNGKVFGNFIGVKPT